ncbi:MAG TPA: response regulator [Bacteroidales bacterium]|jgi:signal transduction histidine kinase/CheY-like chemotaxis protein|nr:response regulator [Bacteroidales bacterium]OQB64583.1 MAG: Signal transduction histidine-protein kinase BarA [Bacteroidetes bacterium ADurb.Bin145]HOU00962.1 response regulator [Bacteroidales bacterium]HQK66647.1 response regulator [Bacteroidales bacterium]
MKRLLTIICTAFIVIIIVNFFYYRSLYNKQISYITTLLNRQSQIVGLSVDGIDNGFASDLNEINFTEDLGEFFNDQVLKARVIESMKLFASKYQDFVTGIRLFDNKRNEFSLKRDEMGEGWLEQTFILHVQGEIHDREQLIKVNRRFDYYLPVIKDNIAVGNIVVTVDYEKYFEEIFSVFNLKDYQWQWVITDSGQIIYNNLETPVRYAEIDRIVSGMDNGTNGNLVHKTSLNGKNETIISSYYSTQLLQRSIALVFSAPADFFQKYILRNSFLIVSATLLLILLIIWFFLRFIKSEKEESRRLSESEKMLFRLIEEMPVGVIIHDKERKILKANKVAASIYSYSGEQEMSGQIYPEEAVTTAGNYFAKNLGSGFNPNQFIIIPRKSGEMILYRNSIPLVFMGREATMEILNDVTMLETARQQEARANEAKSGFLARMSYEIRTPLNEIIGITDVIDNYELSDDVRNIVSLLRRSTEVLLNIINDILDFSKIESGKMILEEIPFNLREEIKYYSELASTHIAGKEIVFSSEIDENIPESIIADPLRIRQVLTNLILHSAANTEKGEIRLRCHSGAIDQGMVTLDFELLDTGRSFDKASLNKIFGDSLNQEARTLKGSDESALGTIIARQLIELMGGTLSAESPSGLSGDAGTKILFSMRVFSNDRMLKDIDLQKIRSFSDIKTLIITGQQNRDEEIINLYHKLGLNISVTSFHKMTAEQIRISLNTPEDAYKLVVIIDEKEFDGFEAVKSIWNQGLADRVIIQMISSNDKKGNYLKSLTMGIDSYLVKPLESLKLSGALKECFPYLETQTGSDAIGNIKKDIAILIVEDNKMNLKVLGTMLQTLGYKYEAVEDGYEGFLKAKDKHYDIIFMDLFMPGMDGFDSSRKIIEKDKSVLIAAFTADNLPETRRKAELSGIREFISKPVRIEELKRLFFKHFKAD